MVDKCPNCGQPSRPGARFCTSCGFRLPERPVEPEPSPLTRSPFATTSTVAASWWPSATASEETTAPTAETPVAAETVAAEAPTTAEEPVAASDDSVIALNAPAADEAPAAEEPVAAPETAEPEPFADWPTFPGYGSSTSEPAPSWGTEPSDTAGATAQTADDLAAAVDQMAGDRSDAGQTTELASDTDGVAPVESVESQAPAPDAPTDADDYDAPPVAEAIPLPSPDATGSSDGLARARSLLDELGALLPALAAPAAPAPPAQDADVSGVVAALSAVRDEAAADQSQLDQLMAVVETARTRPRDIDVMLDLSRHVEAIVALKTDYDRYREAIDSALAQLQTD